MNRSFRLQPLLDLSNLRLDEATRQLGTLLAGEQAASQRLELLIQYRSEYQSKFLTEAQKGLGPEAWRNYQYFLGRLDQAIEQANSMLSLSKQQAAIGKKNWLEKRSKVQAFDTLAQRHQARMTYADGRREQKLSDEHAARNFQGDYEEYDK